MSKFTTLALVICLSAWTVGCSPDTTDAPISPAPNMGSPETPPETPEAGSVEGTPAETP